VKKVLLYLWRPIALCFLSTIEKNDWTLSAVSTTLKVELVAEPGARSGAHLRVPVEGTDSTALMAIS
jgi:hypothetical protein